MTASISWRMAIVSTALAKKEGTAEFYGPLQVGMEGALKLGAAFNRKYGPSVTGRLTIRLREDCWFPLAI